jgi:NAD(P)-dependent dehydrogenase (short-subunit alcohol dehydrogenase family)
MTTSERPSFTRRHIVGGAGVGLAASVAPAIAQGNSSMAKEELQNPTDKYPKPPYKKQSQPWPGLASKMDPRPDHGETSYKGSGRLAGRKALVTGGDSGMGRAAAIAYAREGADVAINYFPTEEPDAKEVIDLIKAEGRVALAIPGDLRDEKFCQELVARAIEGLGGLDILVSNAGRQQAHKSILDISSEDFDATMKTNIYAPFWIIKAALPHLKPGSVIIGTTSEQAYDPTPDLYDYAQTKAATMNYIKSLAKQLGPKGIRVNGVAPGPILDAFASFRRRVHGEAGEVRRRDPPGTRRPARRAWIDLRSACSGGCQFCHRASLWLGRRLRAALTGMPASSAGILMYRHTGRAIEVLLVHSGGPFWRRPVWAVWRLLHAPQCGNSPARSQPRPHNRAGGARI